MKDTAALTVGRGPAGQELPRKQSSDPPRTVKGGRSKDFMVISENETDGLLEYEQKTLAICQ